jgi:acetyl esterase/lipase
LLEHARSYAGDRALDDPLVSPFYAPLAGLPPLFVQAGAVELLVDEARAFAERARAAGVTVRWDEAPEMPHAPVLLAGYHPAAAAALARASGWITARLAGAAG